jgi:hypothetical protein
MPVAGPAASLPQQLIDLRGAGFRPGRDDQLDGMDRAGADLDLLGRVMGDQLLAVDAGHEHGSEAQDPVQAQHVRHQIVREHGERAEVPPSGNPGPFQVRGGDLGTFEEGELECPEAGVVSKAIPGSQPARQAHRRVTGVVDDGGEAPLVTGAHTAAEVAQGGRVERHQRVIGILAEDRRDHGRVHRAQRRCRPRAGPPAVLAQRLGHGAIARPSGSLAQRGKPAGAEVDRVEGEGVGGRVLALRTGQPGDRGRPLGQRQRARVGCDRLRSDLHPTGRRRHLCTCRAKVIHPRQDAGQPDARARRDER